MKGAKMAKYGIEKELWKMNNHTTTCKCFETAHSTDWRPWDGYDPNMREFKCSKCEAVF